MEECESAPASFKRRAWAQSRDSWQAPESQDQGAEEPRSAQPMEDKTSTASETGTVLTLYHYKWNNGANSISGLFVYVLTLIFI